MIIPSFVGPSNTSAALTADADRSINTYVEPIKPGQGKSDAWLRRVPGLSVFASIAGAGVGVEIYAQNDQCWAVVGDQFVQIRFDGSWTAIGTVATSVGIQPTINSNGTAGHQIFITSGLNGYIYDTQTAAFGLIADIDFPQGEALMGAFMDGYFLVLVYQSRKFQISDLYDGTSWDGLDIAERSEASDNLSSMLRSHREIWLYGTQTGEVWYDNGDPDFPFAPVQGVFLEQGTGASFSPRRIGNTTIWLSQDQDGAGIVNMADGYTPTRVSTFALENLMTADNITDCRCWSYQERGHWFYVMHLEGNDTTWVFDLSTGLWHERGTWDEGAEVWHPNRPISHAWVFGKHLVGDRLTGTVYTQSVDLLSQDLADL